MNAPLWQPSAASVRDTSITRFCEWLAPRTGQTLSSYADLYRWSIEQPEDFWRLFWDFAEIQADGKGDSVLLGARQMPGARWFPQARLNFAANLLRHRGAQTALIFRGEDQVQRRLSRDQLYHGAAAMAAGLRSLGVGAGDRVAAYMPNMPETVVAMLGAAAIGAVWSSSSPDFGVQGVIDRFGQIEPRVLICADGYFYNGKRHDSLGKVREILQRLPSVEKVLVVPYTRAQPDLSGIERAELFEEFIDAHACDSIEFEPLAFDHPLYIMYSSGTTGVPKCIVHGAGGTLIQHLKEHLLHADIRAGDRLFFFTTCGWMMWNWLVSGLATGASLMLYDGSPFYPDANTLWDYAAAEGCTQFGVSAKYLDALAKQDLRPAETHDLQALRTLMSTGSPLVPESFDYVYEHIKRDLCLSSMSGGTDIIACFALGCPTLPVWRGELQCLGLGMRVEVWDDAGRPITSEKGELVCTAPFPSMPVGFWNDVDGSRYKAAYFERFPGVWHHGDYVELTEHGGLIIYGRSDAVLNPGGVRIGTAEIYRQAEQIEDVVESLVIGQAWQGDVRVVLFVRLREGLELDDGLRERIRRQIRDNCTPRHVPARILQVVDIPRTKSGKIVELAVREVVHGRPVKNQEALANPQALELFKNRPELAS